MLSCFYLKCFGKNHFNHSNLDPWRGSPAKYHRSMLGKARVTVADRSDPAEPGENCRGAGGGRSEPTARSRYRFLSTEAKLRRAGKGKRLVIENGAEAEVNAGLAAMITEAYAIRNPLLSGSDASNRGTDRPPRNR